MDIRVLKARLTNCLLGSSTEEYLREQVRQIIEDMNNEIEVSDKTIDSGMVSSVVDELRQHYFALLDQYGALPKTFGKVVDRANMIDDMTITLSKIISYMSYAISRNASSTDPSIQRVCAVLKPEMESYRKELYNLGMLMQNIIMDKKIYLEKLKDNNE
jgi:hypothetical protein